MNDQVTDGSPFRFHTGQVTALSAAEGVRRSSGQSVDPGARSPLDRPSKPTEEGVPQSASAEALKARVRAEYREMPGLCLTLPQACRLWQLDVRTSASILDALVAEGFLRRTSQGGFRAAED